MGNKCGGKHAKRGSGNDFPPLANAVPVDSLEKAEPVEVAGDKSSILIQIEEKKSKDTHADQLRAEQIQTENDENKRIQEQTEKESLEKEQAQRLEQQKLELLEQEEQERKIAEQFLTALHEQEHTGINIIRALWLGKNIRSNYLHDRRRILLLQSLCRSHIAHIHPITPQIIDPIVEISEDSKILLAYTIQSILQSKIIMMNYMHDINRIKSLQSLIRGHIINNSDQISRIIALQSLCRGAIQQKKVISLRRQRKREQLALQKKEKIQQQKEQAIKLAKKYKKYIKRKFVDLDIICVKRVPIPVISPTIQLKPIPALDAVSLSPALGIKPLPFLTSQQKRTSFRRTDSMIGLSVNPLRIIDIKPITKTENTLSVAPLKNVMGDGPRPFTRSPTTVSQPPKDILGDTSTLVFASRTQQLRPEDLGSPRIEVSTPLEEKGKQWKPYIALSKKLRKKKHHHMIYFGSNALFQFGFKDSKTTSMMRENKSLGIAIDDWRIVKVSTWTNSLAITDDCVVYGWGYNKSGELGVGHSKCVKGPHYIDVPRSRDISVGTDHTLVLTISRQVHLGMNETFTHLKEFDSKQIDKIFSGNNHFALVSLDGTLYLVPTIREEILPNESTDPTVVRSPDTRRQARQERTKKRSKSIDTSIKYIVQGVKNVKSVSFGEEHILVLTREGNVFSFGNCRNGRLGHGDFRPTVRTVSKKIREPTMISGLHEIIQISAGKDFSVALQKNGNVWAWGANQQGQLGNKSLMNVKRPEIITSLLGIKIISIKCGEEHCLALSDKGVVYAWGRNDWTQLGIGESEEGIRVPVVVSSLSRIFVTEIGAGSLHSFVIGTKR